MRISIRNIQTAILACILALGFSCGNFPGKHNIIIITADDLGPDGTGTGHFGGQMKGLTPNLDSIAALSRCFLNAHVNTSICMPSRGALATGLYGHNSGHYGFFYAHEHVPVFMEILRENGYKTGVLGKVAHSSAKLSQKWDYVHTYEDLGSGRSPSKYYEYTKKFIEWNQNNHTPFYLMINSHDPHRPFQDTSGLLRGAEWPSKMYSPEESFIPRYVSDLPEVREEFSHYYNSVRRLDDTFGKVMKAIFETGAHKNTLVIFFSDNGIAMPFSKANVYRKATRTPLFMYYDGIIKPGDDTMHFVSEIDLFPTLMDITGFSKPDTLDGRSLLPLLLGKIQKNRDFVVNTNDYINRRGAYPMRCIQDASFSYIFNPWSDGITRYANANEGKTFKAMVAASENNDEIAERVRMFRYRDLEEFYDLKKDPDCIDNLTDREEYREKKESYKNKLREWMEDKNDPLLEIFNALGDSARMFSLRDSLYTHELPFLSHVKGAKQYNDSIPEMIKNNPVD